MSLVEHSPPPSLMNPSTDPQEFSYRPIPVLVPISLGLVFVSLVAALTAELLVVPLVGATLAFLAWRMVKRSDGELSGGMLALTALVLQLSMTAAFGAMHVYSYATEVPPGFERVSFASDISAKGFTSEGGLTGVHPDVQKLVNQKIMVKGYMYPTKTTENLKAFVLCKDSGDCCFGGQPKITDMIQVQIKGDPVRYRPGLMAVAGVFRAAPAVDESGLNPVYVLECDYFGPAKTWY